jgi:hypothetical protein
MATTWTVYSAIATDEGFNIVKTRWTEDGPDIEGQTVIEELTNVTEDEALQRVKARQDGYNRVQDSL